MSHGPVDVFAAKNGITLLIQVKSGSSRMKKEDIKILRLWGEAFSANAEVWYYKKRGKLQRLVVREQPIAAQVEFASSSVPHQIPP
jgi:Holliday junction resolvase